ncbi:RNA polymerase sigma factor [Streptomyces odontomachi]|uniref:RNA polymerase sigma factor n=1 Tax=Streptomyces odontomachi TaxID=2944940 RepID=UPI002109FDAC|nr:sigma-70 family RNA polymerase sigma factor [Streptomyces sp. ODS25]
MTEDRTPYLYGTMPMTPEPPELPELPVDFSAFHEMFHDRYVRYARTLVHNRHDAEEVADATFEQLYRKWDQILASENPARYAWRVLRNKAIDHCRARNRRPLIDAAFDVEALREAVDPIRQIEESLALCHALGELPERQHDVMVMQYLVGLPVNSVADVLGITPAAVRSTARHAKRHLRAILEADRAATEEGHRGDLAD